jgi:GTP cyclohydrolase IB
MIDIQSGADDRNIPIDQVGVSDLRYPITVLDRANEKQQTIASLSMSVDLPHQFKGTHMSRFLEVLNEHQGDMSTGRIPLILHDLRERLEAERAHIEIRFPYFIEKSAPVSGAKALMDYECLYLGNVKGKEEDIVIGVTVPVTSLCPCSKAISDYGAHNQRGYVSIKVRALRDKDNTPRMIWIEEIVEIAEESASAPLYPLLKRPDERHVTMQAYDNPVFVEDLVRNVALRLQNDARVAWFSVEAVNHESIHNHNAFARITWSRKGAGVESEDSEAHELTAMAGREI